MGPMMLGSTSAEDDEEAACTQRAGAKHGCLIPFNGTSARAMRLHAPALGQHQGKMMVVTPVPFAVCRTAALSSNGSWQMTRRDAVGCTSSLCISISTLPAKAPGDQGGAAHADDISMASGSHHAVMGRHGHLCVGSDIAAITNITTRQW